MIKKPCKFCGIMLYWLNENGHGVPYEDASCNSRHNCPKFNGSTSNVTARIAKLEEFSNMIANRVESHSERIEKLEDRDDRD